MTVDHPVSAYWRSDSGNEASALHRSAAARGPFFFQNTSPGFTTGPGVPPRAASPRCLRSEDGDDDERSGADTGGELDAGGSAAGRKKRRRGSRGGRRRRRDRPEGGAPAGGAAVSEELGDETAAAVVDVLPGEDEPEFAPAAYRPRAGAVHHEIDEVPPSGEDAPLDLAEPLDEDGKKRRRRGRRGGRRRRRGDEPGAPSTGAAAPFAPAERPLEGDGAPTDSDLEDDAPASPKQAPARRRGPTPEGGPRGKKRRRRGARSGGGKDRRELSEPVELEAIPGEGDGDLPELLPQDSPADSEERTPARGERGRKRKTRRSREDADEDEEPAPRAEVVRNTLILVNAADPEEKRVAVVEDGQIADFQMTVRTENSVVNDIYRGRVVNLEPAIGAAFVDFGQGRNGFLHTSDVLSAYGDDDWSLDKLLTTTIDPDEWDSNSSQPSVGTEVADEDRRGGPKKKAHGKDRRRFRARPRLPITSLLKKGQMVVIQVTKDAIGDKGPTLTTYISIPGRYLVLMPSMSRTGVSRKIEDEKERRRLKKILEQLEIPAGMGVIVRTAGVGHSKADLRRDLDYLKGAWETFAKRLRHGHGPTPLYQESDIAIRTVRDLFTPGTEAVVCDDPQVHQQIQEFTQKLMPEELDRVKLYTGPKPLFHSYGVEADFEKIFSRRIDLPSGGSIVFDQAEALVAIDVNSGRTRSDGFDFEEIALKTNIEAAPEIARQIRLRDLGGIIVVDFIDMMKMSNIKAVERAFKSALDTDRARSKLGRISQFGLLELTRQRLGPGMNKKVFTPCHRCRGTGRIRTIESRAAAVLRRLGSAMTLKGFTLVEVRAHPEVVRYLKELCSEYLRALEYRFEREIQLHEVPDQVEDSVLRYLRADGREVRPGGRRKR